jgi:hypothetical protein
VKKILNYVWIVIDAHARARAATHLVNAGRVKEAQNLMSKK